MAEALTNNAVMNLSLHYSNRFDVWEVRPDLTEILERHGHNKYYIYRKICQFKNHLLLTQEKCYTVEIPSKYEHALLEDISKVCFIKTKRRKITQPLNSEFDDEIMFLITVYK